ncbi:MAG: hypothetical protein KAG97_03160, partial [Victivallales bacterium]|nr:hypothetical protein [Victivallales bacterium]
KPGVFACGNVLHVHDLVDFVSEESERCGREVAAYLEMEGREYADAQTKVVPGANIKYVTPNYRSTDADTHFFMRSMVVADSATLRVSQGDEIMASKKLKHVKPAEMIEFDLGADVDLGNAASDVPLEFSLELVPSM